jgi:predicted CoA-binding protein
MVDPTLKPDSGLCGRGPVPAGGRMGTVHPVTTTTPDAVQELLTTTRTWAVVGASPDPTRDSHRILRALLSWGFDVVPVNPTCDEVAGLPALPSLEALPAGRQIDVVDVFRRSSEAGRHVDEAIALGARGVWLQLGVVDEAAAERARSSGLLVVMDRCPLIEYPKLLRSGRIPQQRPFATEDKSGN